MIESPISSACGKEGCLCVRAIYRTFDWVIAHMWLHYGTCMNQSCHTHETMWHESCHTREHVRHESCHTHEQMWHDSLNTFDMTDLHMCDIHMCDTNQSYVWRDSFKNLTWLIHTCDTNSFICVIAHVATSYSYVCHDPFTRVTWLIRICAMTQSCLSHAHQLQHI